MRKKSLLLFLVISCISFNSIAQVNLTQGLKLHLPFNGNALDASGNGNNAIVNGPIPTTDKLGNPNSAYLFDGVDDFMQIAHNNSIALDSAISMVAHVMPVSFNTNTCQGNVILMKGNADFSQGWYSMRYSDNFADGSCSIVTPSTNNFYGHIVTTSGQPPLGITTAGSPGAPSYIQANVWYCVVVTWDGDTLKTYVDGLLKHKYHLNVPPNSTNTDDLFIGKTLMPSFQYLLNGKLDEIRIYNRAINQDEVKALCTNCAPPTLTISNSVSICANSSTTLNASGASNYLWQPAASLNNATVGNPIATPNASTIYTVVGSNANNCSASATVQVSIYTPAGLSISGQGAICQGDSTVLTANGGNNYIWQPAGFSNTTTGATIKAYPTATTTFTISSSDANNCVASTTKQVLVNVYPLPGASKTNDIQCAVNSAQLSMSNATNYTWSPSATLNNANSSNPIASPLSTTTYTVQAANGTCITIDSVTVIVYDNLLSKIYIPNAITPNNDDINDCLRVISNSKFTEFELRIYNRWGNQVFFSQDPNACWNGNFNGKESNNVNDTYFYILKCKTECGSIERKGDVLLLDQY